VATQEGGIYAAKRGDMGGGGDEWEDNKRRKGKGTGR